MSKLALLLADIRSAYNVGSIFRTADGFGVEKIICTGITPYPKLQSDERLPHVIEKADDMIAKTALGAEKTVAFEYYQDAIEAINKLAGKGYKIYALEQAETSRPLPDFKPSFPSLLILGNEVEGLPQNLLDKCDEILEIPMQGTKESLNVSVACGIALYALTA